MTIKESILKSLEDIGKSATSNEIYLNILNNSYHEFEDEESGKSTISSVLGDFIREGDTRVNRIKSESNFFYYFLNKFSKKEMARHTLFGESLFEDITTGKFYERDLHPLLTTYLKRNNFLSKTIFHENSDNEKDNHQKWIHPDIISVKFTKFNRESSETFLKAVNINDAFKISSYEIKKEILTDYDLKKSYFQAVSNSSWANYGYLVAININNGLMDEIGRLNESFGIGLILLDSNTEKTRVVFPAKYKKLDIKTIDKLSLVNKDFETFIKYVEDILSADKKYVKALEKELTSFCDKEFKTDKEVLSYCKKKNIPYSEE